MTSRANHIPGTVAVHTVWPWRTEHTRGCFYAFLVLCRVSRLATLCLALKGNFSPILDILASDLFNSWKYHVTPPPFFFLSSLFELGKKWPVKRTGWPYSSHSNAFRKEWTWCVHDECLATFGYSVLFFIHLFVCNKEMHIFDTRWGGYSLLSSFSETPNSIYTGKKICGCYYLWCFRRVS